MFNPYFILRPLNSTSIPLAFNLECVARSVYRNVVFICSLMPPGFIYRHPTIVREGEPITWETDIERAFDEAVEEYIQLNPIYVNEYEPVDIIPDGVCLVADKFGYVTVHLRIVSKYYGNVGIFSIHSLLCPGGVRALMTIASYIDPHLYRVYQQHEKRQ